MRKLAFFAPLAAALAVAAMAQAQTPTVNVTVGPELQRQIEKLGEREVNEQIDELKAEVGQALEHRYPGATANLVLVDLKPNRPTFEQIRQASDVQRLNDAPGAQRLQPSYPTMRSGRTQASNCSAVR